MFLQVNISNEDQKSELNKTQTGQLVTYCKEIGLI